MKPRVYYSDLTGRAYVVTRYRETGDGGLVAQTKHDVTDDVVRHLMALAWARGWNECNAASGGDAPENPYRAQTDPATQVATDEAADVAAETRRQG